MLRIKNWEKYQHYKTKNGERPIWLKLYTALLDDYEFQSLPVEARALLPMLWLLAGEQKGLIKDYASVAFRLRQDYGKTENMIKLLIEKGFLVHSRIPLDEVYKDSIPEHIEDIEKKERTEHKDSPPTPSRGKCIKPDDVSETIWEDFKTLRRAKKASITGTAIQGIRREAEKAGIDLESALREMCVRGWQGFKADWYLNSKGKENETFNRNGVNSNPGTSYQQPNKHERAKAALRQSCIDLGIPTE